MHANCPTSSGFELERADVLADFFGRPCPAVVTAVAGGVPPAGTCARYLGRHKVHEGRKELVRELLSNTSAHVPSLTIARAEGLNALLKEGSLDAPGGPCFPWPMLHEAKLLCRGQLRVRYQGLNLQGGLCGDSDGIRLRPSSGTASTCRGSCSTPRR